MSDGENVTNRHLLEELVACRTLLGVQGQALTRVEQALSDLEPRVRVVEVAHATNAQNTAVIADHEDRIRLADKWRHALPPTLIMAALALAGTILQLSQK